MENVLSGFKSLDEITGGFRPGNLIAIASVSAMGSTSLVIDIAAKAKTTKKVLFISTDEGSEWVKNKLNVLSSKLNCVLNVEVMDGYDLYIENIN